jgi:hypothetical protein
LLIICDIFVMHHDNIYMRFGYMDKANDHFIKVCNQEIRKIMIKYEQIAIWQTSISYNKKDSNNLINNKTIPKL